MTMGHEPSPCAMWHVSMGMSDGHIGLECSDATLAMMTCNVRTRHVHVMMLAYTAIRPKVRPQHVFSDGSCNGRSRRVRRCVLGGGLANSQRFSGRR